jgi:hypothetical protein
MDNLLSHSLEDDQEGEVEAKCRVSAFPNLGAQACTVARQKLPATGEQDEREWINQH